MEDLNRWADEDDSYKMGAKYDMFDYSDDDDLGYSSEEQDKPDYEESSDEEPSFEDPRTRINQRMNQMSKPKAKLGPAQRVRTEEKENFSASESSESRSATPSPVKAKKRTPPRQQIARPRSAVQRPATASTFRPQTSTMGTSKPKPKKTDRVALIQQRQRQWAGVNHLASGRQGRKLNLAERNMAYAGRFTAVKNSRLKMYDYKPPHERRRDEVRLNVRSKMAQHAEVPLYS